MEEEESQGRPRRCPCSDDDLRGDVAPATEVRGGGRRGGDKVRRGRGSGVAARRHRVEAAASGGLVTKLRGVGGIRAEAGGRPGEGAPA